MDTGKLSRRRFFQTAAAGGVTLAMAPSLADRIFSLWAAAAEHQRAVLSLPQMLTLAAVAAQIIPTDDTPGAREAGAVEHINHKLHESQRLRPVYQEGLAAVDEASKTKFGKVFVSLEESQQREVLKTMEQSPFFAQVWRDTVEAFVRSTAGQELIGYPGAAQPHGYHDIASPPTASRGGPAGAASEPLAEGAKSQDAAARGKEIFDRNCAMCHEATSEEYKAGPGLKSLFRQPPHALSDGKEHSHTAEFIRREIEKGSGSMPGYEGALSKEELDDLMSYLRTL